MARPRKEIDQNIFENMYRIQCTKEEIAGVLGCSEDTIERFCKREYGGSFAVVYKKHADQGKMSLRRMQFKLAEKNASMAIWLGKQYLGQREPEAEIKVGNLDLFTSIMRETPQI